MSSMSKLLQILDFFSPENRWLKQFSELVNKICLFVDYDQSQRDARDKTREAQRSKCNERDLSYHVTYKNRILHYLGGISDLPVRF